MRNLVDELIMSTMQPKITDIYLTPLSPISAAEKEFLELRGEFRSKVLRGGEMK